MNDNIKFEIKTVNKLLMKHALEHVEAIKDKEDLRKNNNVRKHTKVIFPYELVGSSGIILKYCVKDAHEYKIVRFIPSGFNDGISNHEAGKFNKSCRKSCSKFIQWLRCKRVNAVKDFKSESEWE